MRTFSREEIVCHETSDRSGYIPPRGEVSIPFKVSKASGPVTYRLRLLGEPDYFWKWRTEWGSPYAIAMSIDDVLTTRDTYHEQFSLEFPCHGDTHPRNAYIKLFQTDLKPGAKSVFSIPVKAENFKCNGEAGAHLEIYYAKKGRHPNDVFDAPDKTIDLLFPDGTHDWTVLEKQFVLPKNAVCIIMRLGVKNTFGKLLVGSPRLCFDGGESVIPSLARTQARKAQLNYLGENLSRRDWLECAVEVDGKEIFRGEKYTGIVRRPEYTFDAGSLKPGKHVFTLKLLNDFENAVGFIVQGLELHTLGNHDFEFIGAPETVSPRSQFTAVVRTTKPNVTVSSGNASVTFGEAGLHGIKLKAPAKGTKTFELSCKGFRDSFEVTAVQASEPAVYLGTGDSVYIPQTTEDVERYIEWYVANHIGNCICFRHCYRWDGGRSLNEPMWRNTVRILNEIGLHYTVMVDGREIPGMNANPPERLVQGPLYIGRRSHENDGSLCYWSNQLWFVEPFPEPYGDILSRSVDPGGIQPHIRPKRSGDKAWWFFNPEQSKNAKEAADYFVANLKDAKGDSTRHSGPSALFRYFFQAGYDCLLAEQMYGPEEVILSSLRGASRAYGKENFGTHLATQWSSGPLDTPNHAARYFLSLAVSYMHGATDINTEEGLWRMESGYSDYDRFSHNCVIHQKAHAEFRKFMEANPRTGRLVTPMACIQGRYDGWRCFGRGNVWCNEGDEWRFSDAEASFDLIKLFYPRSKLDSIYEKQCTDEPKGWYTGTPYGYIDLFPSEGDWNAYSALAFLGWHTYEKGDGEKMLDYVKNGGYLLLCRRHLNMALTRDGTLRYPVGDKALDVLLGAGWKTATGVRMTSVGKGMVFYVASDEWPASNAISDEYAICLKKLAEHIVAEEFERGWIKSNEDVEFACYEQGDGSRVFYLLNIRWWDRKTSTVTFQRGGRREKIRVPFGKIVVFTMS
ncbi:MAG: hypothetical protein J6X55_13120 [Victivallales bacterium]|nr:hypothetical protein [Victivallales bacterium]